MGFFRGALNSSRFGIPGPQQCRQNRFHRIFRIYYWRRRIGVLLGGGGECTDGSCGSYTGTSMVMATFFGRIRDKEASEDGRADKYVSFRMTRALHDKFVEKYGSVLCSGIQKAIYNGRHFDLRIDADKEAFRAAGAHHDDDKCCMVVGDGARWGLELILDEIKAKGMTSESFCGENGNQK